ncbi:threonylcarbamoyl-AMP synthase [Desulfosarcina sp. OttesenSCG-928-A07]|nr:threonylcarbamoyl-AMP synthase [Desulfosarcina sp. OttesenSCG-928-A07]
MLYAINPDTPQERLIRKVAGILNAGGVIAYPTDTYYGIGCDLLNKNAIEKVYQLKQRSKNQPFSFICADLKNISEYAKVSNYAYKTMRRFLPGPYTFILPGSKLVPKIMLTKRKTVGIRVPDHPICLLLVEALGHPIISTSATTPDGEVFRDPSLIQDYFGSRLDGIIDGGPVPGAPSSVISLEGDEPVVIREGLGDVGPFR